MAKKSTTNKNVKNSIKRNSIKNEVYQERVTRVKKKHTAEELPLLINPEDTEENPLTFERLMDWLASTGWVYGYVRKRISPMDANLYEDFAQSCWIQILQCKPERIMEIWHKGKGAFINYIKVVIDTQLKSSDTPTYKVIKHFHHTHHLLSDEQWRNFEEGIDHSTFIDTYPVKFMCPSGNRKKMVTMEHEELPIYIDKSEYSLYE